MTSRKLHAFEEESDQWYVEEPWAARELFSVCSFRGSVYDPCCGMGNIPKAALQAGYRVLGTDLADDRPFGFGDIDFFKLSACPGVDIVSNPPYKQDGKPFIEKFIDHALAVTDADARVAVFTRLAFLSSEKRYGMFTQKWPVRAVLVCSKRVNCLPGKLIMEGEKPGGGAIDYCWVVFDKAYSGLPVIGWLYPELEGENA